MVKMENKKMTTPIVSVGADTIGVVNHKTN